MIISRIVLKNWRNFRSVDVNLRERTFLVGPNASGKSNFLDALRFLRDIAKDGGGLQKAISDRGGVSKIRCLAARQQPDVEIEVTLSNGGGQDADWRYALGIRQEVRGRRQPQVHYERVFRGGKEILTRPDKADREDELLLTETHLEQISKNAEFREIAGVFDSIQYLHLVPQLVRFSTVFAGTTLPQDPFGQSFLERIARAPEKVRQARLKRIEEALRVAVPQFKHLSLRRDEVSGAPHLEALYEHWRPQGAKQREDQFSDGTLRLIGLLWSLLDGDAPLLLEEPELSLNSGIVRVLPALMYRALRPKKRQIVVSTHSAELLSDKSIGGDEVLLLTPSPDGTRVEPASERREIRALLESGWSIAEAALPQVEPQNALQLSLFPSR